MPNKTTTAKTDESRKQKRLIKKYQHREHWMTGAIIGAVIIILLLLFLLGNATNWTRGLRKDASIVPAATTDKASGDNQTETQANLNNGGGGTNTRTNNTGSTATHHTSDSNTTHSTTNTTTTTTTETPSAPNPSNLIDLYTDISVGDNINDILGLATNLGLTITCSDNLLLLIQECSFSENGVSVTTRNILGTGIVLSITENIN